MMCIAGGGWRVVGTQGLWTWDQQSKYPCVWMAKRQGAAKKPRHPPPFMPNFIFITCQIGAERAIKGEIARRWPEWRFAFSQPGFLTFKLPDQHGLADDFDLDAVFARACGFSLGKVTGESSDELVRAAWEGCKGLTIQRIHAWEKDQVGCLAHARRGHVPSSRDFNMPTASVGMAPNVSANEAHRLLLKAHPNARSLARQADDPCRPARPGELVLDCILLSPNQWWIGYHRARLVPSCYPGGMMALEMPPQAVSRAWLKMEEALRWSQLPIPRGARVVEIGSAPGGASQALLARGLIVTGIDPAENGPGRAESSPFYSCSSAEHAGPTPRVPQNTLAHGRHERRPKLHARRGRGDRHSCGSQHPRLAVDTQAIRLGPRRAGARIPRSHKEVGDTTRFGQDSFNITAVKYA